MHDASFMEIVLFDFLETKVEDNLYKVWKLIQFSVPVFSKLEVGSNVVFNTTPSFFIRNL